MIVLSEINYYVDRNNNYYVDTFGNYYYAVSSGDGNSYIYKLFLDSQGRQVIDKTQRYFAVDKIPIVPFNFTPYINNTRVFGFIFYNGKWRPVKSYIPIPQIISYQTANNESMLDAVGDKFLVLTR